MVLHSEPELLDGAPDERNLMPKVSFQTNLDEAQREVHTLNITYRRQPLDRQVVPQIGSKIKFTLRNGRIYDLEVVNVTYCAANHIHHVELHIPRHLSMTIRDWMEHIERQRQAEG